MRKTRRNFNDSEMSLFATVETTWNYANCMPPAASEARGHGTTEPRYGEQSRSCRYSVKTTFRPRANMFVRMFKVVLDRSYTGASLKSASVCVNGGSNLRGMGYMEVSLHHKDGTTTVVELTSGEARHLAQVLNAASNSCNANWRKSSVTP